MDSVPRPALRETFLLPPLQIAPCPPSLTSGTLTLSLSYLKTCPATNPHWAIKHAQKPFVYHFVLNLLVDLLVDKVEQVQPLQELMLRGQEGLLRAKEHDWHHTLELTAIWESASNEFLIWSIFIYFIYVF